MSMRLWRGAAVLAVVTLLAAGSLPGAFAAGETPVPVTYGGHSYLTDVVKPSADKPQSKMWYADGSKWALMATQTDFTTHIFELMANHTWRDTGTVVDTRLNSTGDALWLPAEQELVVASRHATSPLRVSRFSYDSVSRTWASKAGFPVELATVGGSESAAVDQDSTGRLWVTYTRAKKVWVAYSDPSGRNWSAPYNPQVPDFAIKGDDISSLIAFDGQIGVMWSDQASSAFRFAIHRDGDPVSSWTMETPMAGPNVVDDHINLKAAPGPGGTSIYAAVKTSLETAGPNESLVGVLVRRPQQPGAGSWSYASAGTVADNHTRPILMIDEENRQLYFFAMAIDTGADIYYKTSSLDNVSFGAGKGARFLDFTKAVNDVTASKQNVTSSSDLTVLAVAQGSRKYAFAELDLLPAP